MLLLNIKNKLYTRAIILEAAEIFKVKVKEELDENMKNTSNDTKIWLNDIFYLKRNTMKLYQTKNF